MAFKKSLTDLANEAAEAEDQTETTVHGDFDDTPPPAGKTVARLIEYIETGKQPQKPYMGKPKPAADMVRLTFELLAPKNIHEYEVEGVKKERADRISITVSKKLSDKAKYKKLFEKMRRGRPDKRHMAQMLNEAFLVEIYHNTVPASGDKKERTYANLFDKDGGSYITAPRIQKDVLDEGSWVDVPVRDALSPLRLFLFENPTKETWESLYIEGERETKIDGKDVKVSKNWIQELILSAKNFAGSTLDAMLSEVDLPIEEPVAETPAETPSAKAGKPSASDAMAALGLS